MGPFRIALAITGAIVAVAITARRVDEQMSAGPGAGGDATSERLPRRPVDLRPQIRRAINPPPADVAPTRLASVIPFDGDAAAGWVDGGSVRTVAAPAHHDDPIFTNMALAWAPVADGYMQEFLGRLLKDEPAAPVAPPEQLMMEWVPCTPELLASGVDCTTTPRQPGIGYSHDHLVAAAEPPPAPVAIAVTGLAETPVVVTGPPDTTSELEPVLSDPRPSQDDPGMSYEGLVGAWNVSSNATAPMPTRVRVAGTEEEPVDTGGEEAPYDAAGYYTCLCGRDRHGQPYNRQSVVHSHARAYVRVAGDSGMPYLSDEQRDATLRSAWATVPRRRWRDRLRRWWQEVWDPWSVPAATIPPDEPEVPIDEGDEAGP